MKIPIIAVLALTLCLPSLSTAIQPKTALCIKELFVHDEPIDIETNKFLDFVRYSDLYVDKSLLIKDLLERDEKVMVITRPRKWGKSINLDMIKTFLQMHVNSTGNQTIPSKLPSYKYFKHGEISEDDYGGIQKLQNPPLISKYPSFIRANLGQHPVIYIDFASVHGRRLQFVKSRIGDAVAEAFEQHMYVVNYTDRRYKEVEVDYESQYKPEREEWESKRQHFREIIYGYGFHADVCARSVQFLSDLLHEMFGKPAYVLIDGYDTIVKELMFREFKATRDEDERLLDFLADFMKYSFKNNPHVAKGIITGVATLADEPIFSKFDQKVRFNIINNDLSDYYGFTEKEVDALIDHLTFGDGLKNQSHEWYKGYKIGTRPDLIFNPYAIVNVLNKGKVGDYWAKTGTIHFVGNMLKYEDFRIVLEELLRSRNVSVEFNFLHYKKFDLENMKHLVQDDQHKLDRRTVDLILTYLCSIGYLTFAENVPPTQTSKSVQVLVKIPNKEIMQELSNLVVSYYAKPTTKQDHNVYNTSVFAETTK